jgi:hypothetical protein
VAAEAPSPPGGTPERPVRHRRPARRRRREPGARRALTLWAYCHVPARLDRGHVAAVEAQLERFAPGFGDLVLARPTRDTAALEADNANYVGGDINGGVQDLRQTLLRPVPRWNPYRTPLDGVYLCSSSTPPGGGVHGMCGHLAATSALRDVFGVQAVPVPAPLRRRGPSRDAPRAGLAPLPHAGLGPLGDRRRGLRRADGRGLRA